MARQGRPTRLRREQMAQAREGQLGWVLGACERLLRPTVESGAAETTGKRRTAAAQAAMLISMES